MEPGILQLFSFGIIYSEKFVPLYLWTYGNFKSYYLMMRLPAHNCFKLKHCDQCWHLKLYMCVWWSNVVDKLLSSTDRSRKMAIQSSLYASQSKRCINEGHLEMLWKSVFFANILLGLKCIRSEKIKNNAKK